MLSFASNNHDERPKTNFNKSTYKKLNNKQYCCCCYCCRCGFFSFFFFYFIFRMFVVLCLWISMVSCCRCCCSLLLLFFNMNKDVHNVEEKKCVCVNLACLYRTECRFSSNAVCRHHCQQSGLLKYYADKKKKSYV